MTQRRIFRVIASPLKVIFSPFKAFKEIAQNPDFIGLLLILGLILLTTVGAQYASASKIFLGVSQRQSVSPKLHHYPDSYVYVTAFGNYTFKSSQPYVMNYTFIDKTPLIEYSIFWVNATELLTPMNPMVTIANDTFYQTTVKLYQSTTEVGILTSTVKFYSDSRPKISTLLTKTAQWSLGNFTINWFIRSSHAYLVNSTSTIDLASKANLSLLETSVDRAILGSTTSPNNWSRSILIDWSDYGNATLYGGNHTLFTYSGSWVDVVFNVNDTKIDLTTVGLTYSSLLTTNLYSYFPLLALIEAALVFFVNWIIFAGVQLLVARALREKVDPWRHFLVLVGYTFSVTIIQWTAYALLIATLPEIHFQIASWPPTAQEAATVDRNFNETWGHTPAFQVLNFLNFPYINIFDIWQYMLLGAIAVHTFSEAKWGKAIAISITAFLIRFFLKVYLGL